MADIDKDNFLYGELAQFEEYFSIFENINEAVCINTKEGQIFFVNNAALELFGYSKDEIIGMNIIDLYANPDVRPGIIKILEKNGSIKDFPIKLKKKNGEIIDCEFNTNVKIDDKGNKIFYGFIRDTTEKKIAEEKLKESELMHRELFDNMASGVAVYDAIENGNDFVFKDMNKSGQKSSKVDIKKIKGKSILEVFPGAIDIGLFDVLNEVYKTGKSVYIPTILYTDNRISQWADNYVYKLHSGEVVAVYDDVTDKKIAEEHLKSTNKELEDIIEFLPDATFIIDKDKRIIAWNHAMEEMTGISKKEIIGKDRSYAAVPFYGKQRPFLIDLIFEHESRISSKYDFVKRKGNTLYVEIFTPALYNNKGAYIWAIASPLIDAEGNIVGGIESIRDITDQKIAEKKLKESENTLQSLFAAAPIGICLLKNRNFQWINTKMADILGYTKEELVGQNTRLLYDTKEEYERLGKLLYPKTSADIYTSAESRLKRKDGTIIDCFTSLSPLDPLDHSKGFITTLMDVTERKNLEREFNELAKFPNENPNPVLRINNNGVILYANVPGYNLLNVWNKKIGEAVPDAIIKNISKALDSGAVISEELTCDGHILSLGYAPIIREGYVNIYGIDITAKKKAEEYLKESEEKYRLIVENTGDIVCLMDLKGNITFMGKSVEADTGYKDFELVGRNIKEILSEKSYIEANERIKLRLKGADKLPNYEAEILSKKGLSIPFELCTSPVFIDGRLTSILILARNIFRRKKNEEEIKDLTETIRILNKILRHDILNDLTLLLNIVDSCKGGDEKMKKSIFATINKSVSLIERMRELEQAVTSGDDLKQCTGLEIVDCVIRNYPEIEFKVKGDCTVLADEAIGSVIDNIVRNAIVHGKTKRIDITLVEGKEHCEIRIADYGIGIPDTIKNRIFEEGFSYGEVRSSGIGLYIVKKVMERYDGEITVEDNKPNGAVFVLKFKKA